MADSPGPRSADGLSSSLRRIVFPVLRKRQNECEYIVRAIADSPGPRSAGGPSSSKRRISVPNVDDHEAHLAL